MCQENHGHEHGNESPLRHTCCPNSRAAERDGTGITRRGFLGGAGGAALGGMALTGLTWSSLAAAGPEVAPPPPRRPLVVKPLFLYRTYQRVPQRSWRSWGGIETQQNADEEAVRINGELEKLQAGADFPVKFLALESLKDERGLADNKDVQAADVLLVYACDGDLNQIAKLKKDTIFFVRHRSGPVYLYYEIISPRFLRQHTDLLAVEGIDDGDVVVDSQDEILWRLRGLCGLHNTVGTKILAVGGPGGWAQPSDVITNLVKEKWKLDIQTVPYADLGKLIQAAREDEAAVALARQRAEAYLKLPDTTLETKREFVDNAFLLDQVFRKLMAEADCRAITINGCMGTIMPMAETSACLTLSTLNDDGYMAYCESDFVVIPSGILMTAISGRPMFFNDPTYPHDGVITLAHCTGPRKLDGKTLEPVRILTHFESDYGAAPKVEMHTGQVLTNIIPDFKEERWVGLMGEVVAHPFLPICRCQIDMGYKVPDQLLAERMPGFHWMTIYGDYHREIGYALKKIPIEWDFLG
ncbi:MAG: twin-arginine translocation signal domain-containing protein [Planctomycetota bacterium]